MPRYSRAFRQKLWRKVTYRKFKRNLIQGALLILRFGDLVVEGNAGVPAGFPHMFEYLQHMRRARQFRLWTQKENDPH